MILVQTGEGSIFCTLERFKVEKFMPTIRRVMDLSRTVVSRGVNECGWFVLSGIRIQIVTNVVNKIVFVLQNVCESG